MDLSIIIPARNEMFLVKTIEDILENIEGDTEIIAVCDGNWPSPAIKDHPRVNIIYHSKSVGQRAATNEGVKISKAKFIMKADAHCAFDKGFDVKLMQDCEHDWVVVPKMYNLHAFDWECTNCKTRVYQGGKPEKCSKCNGTEHEIVIVWKPRLNRMTTYWRFDRDMRFQYWTAFKKRPEADNDIVDIMCNLGACWFMHREHYWNIEGLDEGHGSWGQMGVEIACKAWLSGGRHVVNKKTWFAHMFRTGKGFGFPYKISARDQEKARIYSRDMWLNNKWSKAKRPLAWIINKFNPPEWEDYLIKTNHKEDN